MHRKQILSKQTDWLTEYRKNRINKYLTQKDDSDFPLDLFNVTYSLYKNKTDNDPEKNMILQKILKDNDIQKMTTENELLSHAFTVNFLNRLTEKLEEETLTEFLLDELLDEIKGKTQKVQKMLLLIGNTAGNEKGIIDFLSKEVSIDLINIDQLLLNLSKIDFLFKKGESNDYGEVDGVRLGDDINQIIPSELADDEEIFWTKIANHSFLQYDSKIKRKPETVLILMDRSGSMHNSNKMTISRSVAIAIAQKYLKDGGDAYLLFFEESTYPDEPISLKKDKIKFMGDLFTLVNDGGTNFDYAMEQAKKFCEKTTVDRVVIITDGGSSASAILPKEKLISIFVGGWNQYLANISKESFKVDEFKKLVKVLEGK